MDLAKIFMIKNDDKRSTNVLINIDLLTDAIIGGDLAEKDRETLK